MKIVPQRMNISYNDPLASLGTCTDGCGFREFIGVKLNFSMPITPPGTEVPDACDILVRVLFCVMIMILYLGFKMILLSLVTSICIWSWGRSDRDGVEEAIMEGVMEMEETSASEVDDATKVEKAVLEGSSSSS